MDYWQQVVIFFKELPWIDIGISIAIFLLFLLFRKIFTSYIYKIIVRLSRKTPTELFTNVLLAYEKPVRIFFVILGTYLALLYLPFNITTISYVNTVYEAAIILLIGWGLYNFTSEHSTLFIRLAKKTEVGESSMLVPFLSKLLRFVVIEIGRAHV